VLAPAFPIRLDRLCGPLAVLQEVDLADFQPWLLRLWLVLVFVIVPVA